MRIKSRGWWVTQTISKAPYELFLALFTRLHIMCACMWIHDMIWLQWVLGKSCAEHQRLHHCLLGASGSLSLFHCYWINLSVGCLSTMISLAHESNKRTLDYWFMTSLKWTIEKLIWWLLLLVTRWASSSPQNVLFPLHRARGEGSACISLFVRLDDKYLV